ncbi:hypothetical protein LY474_05350 [Myxococcus stipitatus]|uniref:hypothetical protein n=1 Tax=Myxococcus stipitatus TaxID=83455 RepID=UPI001F443E4D|nr:hypothetical protein [Myxococcus stipitatus]MCE9667236.1 hypothetical protein [Myxococcus stipitatus]
MSRERAPSWPLARRALRAVVVSLNLGLGPSALAAAPSPLASELANRCRAWASDAHEPWSLAHGMALDGRDFRARDGRAAGDVIVSDFLRRAQVDGKDASQADLSFDTATPEGAPVEPHPTLLLKTLLRAGHPLSQRFQAGWGAPVTLQALVDDLRRDFRPDQVATPDAAWTLDALSLVSRPGDTFRTRHGVEVRVDAVMEAALATLEAADAELAAGMKAGRPEVPKRGQGIYAHPCGGLHYVQAVTGWARHPSIRSAWRKRLDAVRDVLLYRLDSEARQYETALAAADREQRARVLSQMLKFYGHLLETLGRYRDDTGWRPTEPQRKVIERARGYLANTVRRMDATGMFGAPSTLAAEAPQRALDLVGDTCHAARGEASWSTPRR